MEKTKKKGARIAKIVAICVVAAVCVAAICLLVKNVTTNSSYGYTGGTAATVKASDASEATEIAEDTVTKYIQDFRTSSNITTDDSWGEWLNSNSYTPTSVRTQVIDYYTENELVKQACQARDITVESSDVDSKVSEMKSNYDSDEEWQEALENAGTTEDQYRESVEIGLLKEKLKENVVGEVKVKNKELLKSLKTYSSYLSGAKRSSHILFSSDDKKTAKKVLKQINSGKISFADAAKKYSTDTSSASNGGDVGWDKINNFVTEYTDALDKLKKGEVSKLVKSDYGYHIIKCTDTFTPTGNETKVSQYPDAIADYVKSMVKSSDESTKYDEWYDDYKEQAEITTNDMPENVPYNVDMTKYESTDSDSGSDSSDSDSDSSDSSDSDSSESSDSSSDDSSSDSSSDDSSSTDSSK